MRVYTVTFAGVNIAAVQDLIALYTGANMAIKLHAIQLGQRTQTTTKNLAVSLKRLKGTITPGAGGNAATPVKVNDGDSAATVTARINDTTPASGSGANTVIMNDVFNVLNGYPWIFPPEDRPVIAPGQVAVLSLDSADAVAETTSGTIWFEELF